ncbi:MAG: tyrosine-protein phosphatase [Pseudomonadota bacterium]
MSQLPQESWKDRLRMTREVTPEMLSTRLGRLWGYVVFNYIDHAYLRVWWTNLDEIAPGVWRSNQPGPRRVRRMYKRLGIKTILLLRGSGTGTHLNFEIEATRDAGITLKTINLSARSAYPASAFLDLLDLFETMERPFLMHCKSGADRAGIASALYLLSIGKPLSDARKMLSFRYFHLKSIRTGILDVMLDHYEEDLANGPIGIREWLSTRYDDARLQREFDQGRRHGKAWP